MLNSWTTQHMCYNWVENHMTIPEQNKILYILKQLQNKSWRKFLKTNQLCMFCGYYKDYGVGLGHCENIMGNDAAWNLEVIRKANDKCDNKPRRGVSFINKNNTKLKF
jgi:hypothetical protein